MSALPVALMATLAGSGEALADDAKPIPVVAYNPALNAFEHVLPHRTEFTIEITRSGIEAEFNAITAWVASQEDPSCPTSRPSSASALAATAGDLGADGKRKYLVQVPRLQFSTGYCFGFEFNRTWSELDKKAVAEAVQTAIATQAKESIFTPGRTRELLEKSLDRRGKLLVTLKATGQKAESSRPLLDLVNEKIGATVVAMGDVWIKYYDDRFNAMMYAREVLANDPKNRAGALFKPAVPTLVVAMDRSWGDLAAAAKSAGYDKELSEDAKTSARGSEPAALSTDEEELKRKATAVAADAGKVVEDAALCKGQNPGPDLKSYCDKVRAVHDAAREVGKLLDAGGLPAKAKKFKELKDGNVKAVGDIVETIQTTEATATTTHTPTPSYTQRGVLYVSADLGGVVPIFWAFGGSTGGAAVAPFLGVNVYGVPVDKDVPLSEDGGFFKRASVTAGITLSSISDSSGSTKGAVNGNGILLGAGYRMTDYLRVGLGGMLVSQKDKNPVVSDTHLRVVPYLSLSIDVDVAGTIQATYAKYK